MPRVIERVVYKFGFELVKEEYIHQFLQLCDYVGHGLSHPNQVEDIVLDGELFDSIWKVYGVHRNDQYYGGYANLIGDKSGWGTHFAWDSYQLLETDELISNVYTQILIPLFEHYGKDCELFPVELCVPTGSIDVDVRYTESRVYQVIAKV